jgi:hypothetical protein
MQSPSLVQLARQAVVPQVYGEHAVVTGAGQVPAPSQLAAAVCVPPLQLATRHEVVLGGKVHVPLVPSQLPPQVVPAFKHAWRPPTGWPLMVLQVPTEPDALHAWHCPVHALAQHTASTQKPELH